MRILISAVAATIVLGFSGVALAGGAASSPVAEPITYSSNDGQVSCRPLVHEGVVTNVIQCHNQAGWDRLRHENTQEAILRFQIHALVQRR